MTYLLVIICAGIGFYFFYNTAQKSIKSDDKVSVFLRSNGLLSKVLGWVLICLSFELSYYFYGLMAGLILSSIVIMCLGSLVVLLVPLISKRLDHAGKS